MPLVVQAVGPQGFGSYALEWSRQGHPALTPSSSQPRGVLTPGFVDLHMHGAFGCDFMNATSHELLELCEKLAAIGYERFLPTTVTARAGEVLAAISNLPDHPLIGGFHLEGPFISPKYPGAQPPADIVSAPAGLSEWDAVLDHPRLRLVTLAPEVPGALALIERLVRRGVIVSLGHSDATYAQASAGFEAGARHATHAFNAMRPFHHREPGLTGFVLLKDELRAELIYDRHHVVNQAAQVLTRCKPKEQILAVSDCTMFAGHAGGGNVELWGHKCVLGEGTIRLADGGALAGSIITLLDAFRNLASDFGAEFASRACSLNPRVALGMTDPPKTYVLFDERFEVLEVRLTSQGIFDA